MPGSRKAQLVWLGVLGAVTISLAVAAMLPWRPVPPALTALPQASPSLSSRTSPTSSASPASPASPVTGLARVADRLLGGETVSVLVIGDGSGNEADEWVSVWARDHLASQQRRVTYRPGNGPGTGYLKGRESGSGATRVTVWNASLRSPDLTREAVRVGEVWRTADIVFYSYGHRKTATDLRRELPRIHAAVLKQNPRALAVLVAQNPDLPQTAAVQRDAVRATKAWASSQGVPIIDVYAAFSADRRSLAELVEWDGSPSPAGSRLWSRTVQRALEDA